jgi:hypothetical protein
MAAEATARAEARDLYRNLHVLAGLSVALVAA